MVRKLARGRAKARSSRLGRGHNGAETTEAVGKGSVAKGGGRGHASSAAIGRAAGNEGPLPGKYRGSRSTSAADGRGGAAGTGSGQAKDLNIILPRGSSPRVREALARSADSLWGLDLTPHALLRELHDVLLLRCLQEAGGNYAMAAELFGPSRQSVQQYANSSLRDVRWRAYRRNRRRAADEMS